MRAHGRRTRVTPRENFQPRTDPILAIAGKHDKQLTAQLKTALVHLRTLVPVAVVEHAIKLGSIDHVLGAIPFDHYKEVLKEPMQLIGDIYEAAGQHGAGQIASKMKSGRKRLRYKPQHLRLVKDAASDAAAAEVGFAFDRFDDNTQKRLGEIIDGLIVDLGDAAKETIQSVVLRGVQAGDTAAEIAANIRDTISLTPAQADAVASYRRALEDLDSNALDRALRDSSYDALVEDAIDSGEFLSDDIIGDAVDAYLENYIDYRAATIARTESLRAGNAGLRDGYTQAAERGAIPGDAVKRVWLLDLDENTCDICLGILDADPDGVGLDEEFSEGDPPVHPNCRCTIQYETDLDMVPDEADTEDA
jgi:Phage Mu protein F like protein